MGRRIVIPEICAEWTHSELVQSPRDEKELTAPAVLVRRLIPKIAGPRGEELLSLPGEPVISLFTGAGGMDLGLEMAGWTTVVQHERSAAACGTLIGNRPRYFRHAALIQGDIRQTPTSLLLREAGLRVGEAGAVVGGPPCQGFSTGNAKAVRHEGDARNDLVFEYLRVVREAQPRFFIFENVPGILRFQGGRYVRWLLEQAHSAFYELVYGLVDCVEYGVPQHRVRFICMGTRRDLTECDGLLAGLPAPDCFSDHDLRTIREAEVSLFGDGAARRLRRAPGIRYFPDRPVLIPPVPTCSQGRSSEGFGRSDTFLDFYDQLEREEPDRLVAMVDA